MPELLVASLLTIVVGALTLSTVVGPLEAIRRSTFPDVRRAEVEAAADVLVRTLRSARPGLGEEHPISLDAGRVVVRSGPPSERRSVVIELVGGDMRLSSALDGAGEPQGRILLRDVGTDSLRIDAFDASGGRLPAEAAGTASAIAVDVHVDGYRAQRVIALRNDAVHAQVAGW